jgi:hypothetical protein
MPTNGLTILSKYLCLRNRLECISRRFLFCGVPDTTKLQSTRVLIWKFVLYLEDEYKTG